MESRRWSQVEELFHRACECEPARRAQLLREAAGDDPELCRVVEELLAAEPGAPQELHAAVYDVLDEVAFPLVGETVSHYRVLAGIGTGGMGSVYKAEDLRLGRPVALKFLPDELTRDTMALKRLEQEARAASALNHPNVCTIYEIAEHLGRPFIVMELLEGETLREQIDEQKRESRRPSPARLIELGIQVSDALAAAHASGIIHRDIKPANIFVPRSGLAKILDFGVAKLSRQARSSTGGNASGEIGPEPPAEDPSLTRTGLTVGTAGYMSPEQVRGEELDGRTDLFSLGLVLYEFATGRAAFGGATAELMRDAILHSNPTPVRELSPHVPEGLARVIHKALEKDRARRYQRADEMRADLEHLRARALPQPAFRWKVLAAATVVALVLAAPMVWLLWRQPEAPADRRASLRKLTTNSWENPVRFSSLSPDGRYLAYTDPKGMHIQSVGAEESHLVPQPVALASEDVVWELDYNSSVWFPDSRRFLATSHPAAESQAEWSSSTSSVWVIDVSGGAPQLLRAGALGWSVSPDGAWVSFGTGKGRLGERQAWIMAPDGKQAHSIFEVDAAQAICCVYFFADGTRVAYLLADDSGDRLFARDLKGGPATRLLHPAIGDIGDFAWLPDGRLIYADVCNFGRFDTPCNLWIERFDTYSGRLIDKPRRLTTVVGATLSFPSITADGRLVTFQQSTSYSTAYVAEMEAAATGIRDVRHFTLEEGDDAIADWIADSEAAIVLKNRGDYSAVYQQTVRDNEIKPIVARLPGALLEGALVSPDGKWLSLALWRLPSSTAPPWFRAPPPLEIWRVPINGLQAQRLFSPALGSNLSCARAPSTLCVLGEPTADRREVMVSAFDPSTGQRGHELLRFERYANSTDDIAPLAFALSPDGERISTSPAPSGPLRILSLRGAPTREIPLTGVTVKAEARWTPDGKGLIVTGYRSDGAELLYVDLQAHVRVLWQCESGQSCFGVPSPDGRHLGISQTRVNSNVWMLENF